MPAGAPYEATSNELCFAVVRKRAFESPRSHARSGAGRTTSDARRADDLNLFRKADDPPPMITVPAATSSHPIEFFPMLPLRNNTC